MTCPGSGAVAGDGAGAPASSGTDAARVATVPTMVAGRPGCVPAGWPKMTARWPVPVPTWKARATSGAAANPAPAGREAVIAHTPAATAVTVARETAHTSGVSERKETGRRDDAVARRVTGAPTIVAGFPADVPAGWPNVMV